VRFRLPGSTAADTESADESVDVSMLVPNDGNAMTDETDKSVAMQ
jgi:hypothetical protein